MKHIILIKLIEKPIFGAKTSSLNKDQVVRSQVSITFLEAPNSVLTVGENFIAVAQIKLALFKF